MLEYHVYFHLCTIYWTMFHIFQLPCFDGYLLKKLLIIVLPIANTQEEAGVLLKLHPMVDTFPDIGENVLILIVATQLKVKETIPIKLQCENVKSYQ